MTKGNEELKNILAERYRNKRRLGVPLDDRGGSEKNDIESGLAEKYAADLLGCEFDDNIYAGGDDGYDFIFNKYKIDVKWMGFLKNSNNEPRKSGRIIVDVHKIGLSDIYIAVSGSENSGFRCLGWCTVRDLKNRPLWKSTFMDENGLYERYAIHTDELRHINTLIEMKKQ